MIGSQHLILPPVFAARAFARKDSEEFVLRLSLGGLRNLSDFKSEWKYKILSSFQSIYSAANFCFNKGLCMI